MGSSLNSNAVQDKLVLLLSVVTLLPLFILSFYNHPCIDDYDFTNVAIQKGFFGAQKWWYYGWCGRYFFNIIISLNPMVFGASWAYKLNSIILLLLLIFATYWLSGKLFRNISKTVKLEITSLFIFSYIILMPDIGQGIFWQAGAYNWFTPDIMTFLLLGCIISCLGSASKIYSNGRKGFWYLLFSCLLIIAIIGSYEIQMIFIDLFIFLFLIITILRKQKVFLPLTLLLVCVVFSLIEIKAPGNRVRTSYEFHNSFHLLSALKLTISYSKIYLIHWLPFMLLISLVLFSILSKPLKSLLFTPHSSISTLPPGLIFMGCISIPFIGVFIPLFVEGKFPPEHIVDGIYFYFAAGMMYFSFSAIVYISSRYPDFKLSFYKKITLISVLLLFSNDSSTNVFKNNITNAYIDIFSGKAAAYNRERNERDEFLRSFKGDSCVIDSIKDIPTTLFFRELPRDRNNWENTAFCQYYHKKYIGIKRK